VRVVNGVPSTTTAACQAVTAAWPSTLPSITTLHAPLFDGTSTALEVIGRWLVARYTFSL
jgi:glycerate kinase